MKKEQTWWYKAGFNKEVGKRLLNAIKYLLILMGIWGILTLILFFGSERVKLDMFKSFGCMFYGCDNFNFDAIKGFPLDDVPSPELVEELPLDQEFEFIPTIYNYSYYKYTPRIYSHQGLYQDLEIDLTGNIGLVYTEFESMNGPLDTKYMDNTHHVLQRWRGDSEFRCFIFRWYPKYTDSNLSKLNEEFKEGENPNNCTPIYLPEYLDNRANHDGIFQFLVAPIEEGVLSTGRIKAQHRYWKADNYYLQ